MDTMKAPDVASFKISMDEEIDNLTTNSIYELILCSNIPEMYNILRVVWSHIRKPPLMASYNDIDQESVLMGANRKKELTIFRHIHQ